MAGLRPRQHYEIEICDKRLKNTVKNMPGAGSVVPSVVVTAY